MPNALVDAFLAGDVAAAAAHLAPDATFHSPVADYDGRERIAALWATVAQILEDPQPTGLVEGEGEAVAFFTGTFDGRPGDGMLRVVGEPARDVTLMVRPLETLIAAVKEMGRLLDLPAAGPVAGR
jgi:hypothetical protein